MSKIQVDTIDTRSGTSTMQIGSTNTTTINLGVSGDTVNIPSGVTIANAGTATGFGSTPPNWNAYLSSNQTIATSTTTLVIFNAELFDSNSAYDTSTGKFTVPSGEAGKYYFGAMGYMNINDTNIFSLELYVNNSAVALSRVRTGANGTIAQGVNIIRDLSVGDYVTVKVDQTYGSDRDLVSGSSISGFWGCKLAS